MSNKFIKVACVSILSAGLLAACGGGGGSDAPATTFLTSDFSGKSLYLVNGSTYQLGIFEADGSTKGSDQMTSGTPIATTQTSTWSVANGEMKIVNGNDAIRYTIVSNDTANRFFKATKHNLSGTTRQVGMFYDQSTGLAQAQAQAYVIAGTQP